MSLILDGTQGLFGDVNGGNISGNFIINSANLQDGSVTESKIGPITATGSTTARSLQDRFADIVYVEDFGATGSGANETTQIQNALNAVSFGGTIVFGKNKTYSVNTLSSSNASVIDLNGSKLIRRQMVSGATGTLLSVNPNTSFDITGLSISVTKNSNLIISSDVAAQLQVGDLIRIRSNTVAVTSSSGDYTFGQYATVNHISGSSIYISVPFYESFPINSITVLRGNESFYIKNGFLDTSLTPNEFVNVTALGIRGQNIIVENLNFQGSYYSAQLLSPSGENIIVRNCYFNKCRGDLGYGVNTFGNNITIENCIFMDCKHATTSASRDTAGIKITIRDCFITETNIDPADSGFTGAIDFHSNVAGVCTIDNVEVYAQRRFIQKRTPYALLKVLNSKFVAIQNTLNNLISGVEVSVQDISFNNCDFTITSGSSLLSNFLVSGQNNISNENILFDSCVFNGGSIVDGRLPLINTTIQNCVINQSNAITLSPESGDLLFSNLKILNNELTGGNFLLLRITNGGTSSGLKISGNKFTRNSTTASNPIAIRNMTTDGSATFNDVEISDNTINFLSGDTTTISAIATRDLSFTGFKLVNNFINRISTEEAINLRNTSITRGLISGNTINSTLRIDANPSPITLTQLTVTNNTGETYIVGATNGGTITKSRYLFDTGTNNFSSITP